MRRSCNRPRRLRCPRPRLHPRSRDRPRPRASDRRDPRLARRRAHYRRRMHPPSRVPVHSADPGRGLRRAAIAHRKDRTFRPCPVPGRLRRNRLRRQFRACRFYPAGKRRAWLRGRRHCSSRSAAFVQRNSQPARRAASCLRCSAGSRAPHRSPARSFQGVPARALPSLPALPLRPGVHPPSQRLDRQDAPAPRPQARHRAPGGSCEAGLR